VVLCEPFDVTPDEQAKKLRKLPWAQTGKITVWENGLRREVFCLHIRSVAGWLFTLNAGKVAPHLRTKLAWEGCSPARAGARWLFLSPNTTSF
jgi:hypothetical protein